MNRPTKKRESHENISTCTVYFEGAKKKWAASVVFTDKRTKHYYSPYREDCERWLSLAAQKSSKDDIDEARVADEEVVKYIESLGYHNVAKIPGSKFYWLTGEGCLFSTATGCVRLRRRSHGKYYALCKDSREVTCTLERLQWCVENGVDPWTLAKEKLSVHREGEQLALMTTVEHIRRTMKAKHKERVNSNLLAWHQKAAKWNQNIVSLLTGDTHVAREIKSMIEDERQNLEEYIHGTLFITDKIKVKYLVEESLSETYTRVMSKSYIVINPMTYVRVMARKYKRMLESSVRFYENKHFFMAENE